MAECLLMKSGGGGILSEDVTATLADVLTTKTALTSDSLDDAGTGTMRNCHDSDYVTTLSSSDSRRVIPCADKWTYINADGTKRVSLELPQTGYYTSNDIVAVEPSTLVSATGAGYWGTASASNVLAGKTFTTANGFAVTGTMPDYASGRVVFNYGTFDGTLVSGVQDISDSNDATAYTELVAGVGVHMYSNYVPYKTDPYGAAIVVFKNYSINLTPFSKIRIKLDGTTSNPEDNGTKTSIWLLGSDKTTKVSTLLSNYATYGDFVIDRTFDISSINQQCFLCVKTTVFRDTGNEALPHQDSYVRYIELIN